MAEKVYEAVRQTAEVRKERTPPATVAPQMAKVQKAPEIVMHQGMALGKSPLLGD